MNLSKSTPSWLAALALLLLAACSSGPTVRTDADPAADFSRYRSWDFYQPIAMEANGYTSHTSEQVRAAVAREMEARGYVHDTTAPDLKVNFQGLVQDKTDVYTLPRTDWQYFYSYRANSYVAVPVWYDETQVSRYREGTLTVDLVDARANRLLWTGSAIGRIPAKQSPEKRAVAVEQAVAAVFARYPHRAQPVTGP